MPRRILCEELKHIATEPNPSEVIKALDQDGLGRRAAAVGGDDDPEAVRIDRRPR
jgi:hypothetical protein